jgi:hypothetical protein
MPSRTPLPFGGSAVASLSHRRLGRAAVGDPTTWAKAYRESNRNVAATQSVLVPSGSAVLVCAVLRSFWPIFWQIEFNNQPFAVVFSFSVGAFHKLLGELLQCLSHLLQFLALIEWSRPRHIAAIGGIATEFFDPFQGNSS